MQVVFPHLVSSLFSLGSYRLCKMCIRVRFGIPYRKKVTAKMIGIYFEYREVRNALKAYELLDTLDPCKVCLLYTS